MSSQSVQQRCIVIDTFIFVMILYRMYIIFMFSLSYPMVRPSIHHIVKHMPTCLGQVFRGRLAVVLEHETFLGVRRIAVRQTRGFPPARAGAIVNRHVQILPDGESHRCADVAVKLRLRWVALIKVTQHFWWDQGTMPWSWHKQQENYRSHHDWRRGSSVEVRTENSIPLLKKSTIIIRHSGVQTILVSHSLTLSLSPSVCLPVSPSNLREFTFVVRRRFVNS